jgi:hypothetical protein
MGLANRLNGECKVESGQGWLQESALNNRQDGGPFLQ